MALSVATGCNPKSGAARRNSVIDSNSDSVRKIVVLKADAPSAASVASDAESTLGGTKGFVYNEALKGFTITLSRTAADQLAKDPRVAYVMDDRLLKNTGLEQPQPVQTPQAETTPSGIARTLATNTKTFADKKDVDATIAVLDTGIDLTHPDLNVTESVSFVGDNARGNDVYGHGTHVAGTIAARMNDQGVVGMAPGAKLWAIKVLGDDGSGYLSQIIAGIEYIAQNSAKIDVVNMSFGGTGDASTTCGTDSKDAYHQAICGAVAKGVVFVAAAGNNAGDGGNFLPAAYPEVISVSAMVDTDGLPGGKGASTTRGADDTFANFSNFGSVVDVAAPGVDVLSTYPGGKYAKLSGTSMASPHVAGAAALYIARNRAQKPTSGTELADYAKKVASAITSVGYKSGDAGYFSGDPDRYAEPLLNAERLDPKVQPSLTLTATLNKTSFETGVDTSAAFTLTLKNEVGEGVTGLTAGSFKFDLSGTALTVDKLSLKESLDQPGTWSGSLDLKALTAGSYTLTVTVTDSRNLTASASATFTIKPNSINNSQVIRVSAVRYTTTTDIRGNRIVRIAVEVRDLNNLVVSGVQTTVQVSVGSRYLGSATNSTDSLGQARYVVSRAPVGCYTTRVTLLSKTGFTWDKSKDTLAINSCGTSTASPVVVSDTPGQNSPVQNTPAQTTTGTLLSE